MRVRKWMAAEAKSPGRRSDNHMTIMIIRLLGKCQ